MLRKSFILLSFITIFATSAFATFHSKLTVKTSDKAKGLVYVSTKSEIPQTTAFGETKEVKNSASGAGLAPSSANTVYYLYAQPADGMVLDYWSDDENGKTRTVESTINTYTITATSREENKPTEATLYAFFKERPPVMISTDNSTYGAVSFKNPANNEIGKSLTVVANFVFKVTPGDYTNIFSKFVKFEGWYDQNGTLRSSDMTYTFDVEEAVDLTARFTLEQTITEADGYYRIHSAIAPAKAGYINVEADYAPSFTASNRSLQGAMELTPYSYSDPSIILRIKGNGLPKEEIDYKAQQTILKNVELIGQGISTKALTGNVFEIRMGDQPGFYKLYYSSANLYNAYNGSITISSDQTGKSGEIMRLWDFEPLDAEHIDEYFFAAEPVAEMFYEDGYWTSMYTAFPYECWAEDGVEAYYISGLDAAENGTESIATLTLIEDGVVPAYTPVLLKCKSVNPEKNRLLPLTDGPESTEAKPYYDENKLRGELQLNSKTKEKVTFDGSRMRVFSQKDGVMGFYKLEEGTELAANKVWLDVSGLSDSAAKKIVLRSNLSGVEDVMVEEPDFLDHNAPMYNVMGQRIQNPAPGQIYIQNGRKYIAR